MSKSHKRYKPDEIYRVIGVALMFFDGVFFYNGR